MDSPPTSLKILNSSSKVLMTTDKSLSRTYAAQMVQGKKLLQHDIIIKGLGVNMFNYS